MLLKRLVSILLVLAVLFVFIMPAGVTKGDDGQSFGIVTINGVEMYKSKSGETFPIVIFDGKKYIKWHEFDLVSVEDVINCESGKSDVMLGNFINKYQKNHNSINKSEFHVKSPGDKAGYNQTYSSWADKQLGFLEWDSQENQWKKYTIGDAGCFLCSTASELLRYGLKDPVSSNNVDPVNLNEWLKDNEGFNGAELRFSAVEHFPGISYIIDGFNDFNGAARILYQSYPNAPIMCFRSQHPYAPDKYYYHFCLYVKGDGDNPYYKENGVWELNSDEAAYHEVIDSGFDETSDPRGTVRTLTKVYGEGHNGNPYVRPDSGIFRVAFKE